MKFTNLQTVDTTVLQYIQLKINPQLTYTDDKIQVPVIYANALRWSNIKTLNYIAAKDGKVLHPLITIHRIQLLPTYALNKISLNSNLNTYVIPKRKNKLSLIDKIYKKNVLKQLFISIVLPTYMKLTYLLHFWVDFFLHANYIKELLYYHNNLYWNTDDNRFFVSISDFTNLHLTSVDNLRVIHSSCTLTAIAAIYPTLLILHLSNYNTLRNVQHVQIDYTLTLL